MFLKRFFTSLILSPLIIFMILKGNWYFYSLLIIVSIIGLFEIIKINNLIISIIIFIIFSIFIFCSYKIINLNNGSKLFLLILIISWLSDIGGYVFGNIFKGKTIKIISPNKTYIGFLGSVLFGNLAILYNEYNQLFLFKNFYLYIIFFSTASFLVIIGDLAFSFFKRKCKIDDYSNILPGHGGLLDRIDGLIFLTIIFYTFVI